MRPRDEIGRTWPQVLKPHPAPVGAVSRRWTVLELPHERQQQQLHSVGSSFDPGPVPGEEGVPAWGRRTRAYRQVHVPRATRLPYWPILITFSDLLPPEMSENPQEGNPYSQKDCGSPEHERTEPTHRVGGLQREPGSTRRGSYTISEGGRVLSLRPGPAQ